MENKSSREHSSKDPSRRGGSSIELRDGLYYIYTQYLYRVNIIRSRSVATDNIFARFTQATYVVIPPNEWLIYLATRAHL